MHKQQHTRARRNRVLFEQHQHHQQQELLDLENESSSSSCACHNNNAGAEISVSARRLQSRKPGASTASQKHNHAYFLWICGLTSMILLLVVFVIDVVGDPYLMNSDGLRVALSDPQKNYHQNSIKSVNSNMLASAARTYNHSKTTTIPLRDHTKNNSMKTQSSSFGPRDILIFNHNPKAGGGSIKTVLRSLRTYEIRPKGTIKLQAIIQQKPNSTTHNSYFLLHESAKSTKSIRQQGYVIGSIREPCSQYVSLWAYGSAKRGLFRSQLLSWRNNTNSNNNTHTNITTHAAGRRSDRTSAASQEMSFNYYGQDTPYFNTSKDVERFHRWMHHPLVQGIVGNRVRSIYLEDLDGVDCFVYVEQFQSSLIDCLQKFESQGGYVDWSTPLIASMLHSNNKNKHMDGIEINSNSSKTFNNDRTSTSSKRNLFGRPTQVKNDKNDPLENNQVLHHASCTRYFNSASLVQEIQNGPEKFIYDTFGYQGCCSKEIRKAVNARRT